MKDRKYICIDLKSFYASVECVQRGLDPMTAKLVVADPERSRNTICLAVSPAMKKLGVHNRCRLGDIPPTLEYITAPPRMQLYVDYAAEIYRRYLRYISKDDIHVYSIDEAFMDVTDYLDLYGLDARSLGKKIMSDISEELGVRATCGIGTNLYLTKIALDITAKHSPDFIGELDEKRYCETLWNHKPLTDFWRIGRGMATRLAQYALYTMGDIAHTDEDFLYKLFGVDAELLIDHAWGREPVTMADIKNYHSRTNSLSSGQVLMSDYPFEKGRLIVKEMADALCLDLVRKKLVTSSLTLYIGYSDSDGYARGTVALPGESNIPTTIVPALAELYDKIVNPLLAVRRVNICCNNVIDEEYRQLDLFMDSAETERDHKMQKAMLELKEKFGSNAVLKGMNLEKGAMTRERNNQIGGHKA